MKTSSASQPDTAPKHEALEIISHSPKKGSAHKTPLLFVHGAFAGAWCWEESFLPWFAERGWTVHAVSLSGHGSSRNPIGLDNLGINNYVNDVTETIALLPTPPVLIGHSMGGMVVQKYLEKSTVPAAVLMASVPPQGLIHSAIGLLLSAPQLLIDLNRIMGGGEPNPDTMLQTLFYNSLDEKKIQRYLEMFQPESHRAIWDMTFFNLPLVFRIHRPPMLVLGAQHDRLFSPSQVKLTASAYGTRPEIFADMGHAMMLEPNWKEVAERIDGWLNSQGF
ncbi:MAG: alpha/beta hydrolase [Azoarcus sp.]|nr:alpha/beta hydrolase [Azoarcus sp.]